ncbi:MAG: hypothetical protein HYW64_02515 [Candidatus Levybacteria bacterium]|nr:hypothetical protein [Candidatus Levybacteria bacterium]
MDQGQSERPSVPVEPARPGGQTPRSQPKPVSPERVELAREAWRVHNTGKNPDRAELETQEMAIEMGLPPMWGGAEAIADSYTDPRLQRIVDEYNAMAAGTDPARPLPSSELERLIERVGRLRDDLVVNNDESRRLIDYLRVENTRANLAEYGRREEQRPEGFWTTLRTHDFELLREKDFDGFVNKWFDALYEAAAGRDPTTSGALDLVQRAFQEADTYLTTVQQNLPGLAELSNIFETRIRLLTMNWGAISSKSIESIQKGSYGLRAHGLLEGTNLDKGYTGVMFNRLTELLEDERLKEKRGHLTPELANRLQDMIIEETISLRGQFHQDGENEVYDGGGVGIHAGKNRKDIKRAVRSAYDILVDSQRMHIIAARGKELFGTDAFFSDAGAAFKAFSPKTFASEKWGMLTVTDQRFLQEVIEKSLVDEWLENKKETYKDIILTPQQRRELGDILFKFISSPPDFFSSGWRIKGMKDQLQNYFVHRAYVKEAAKDKGLSPEAFKVTDWEDFRRKLEDEDKGKIKEDKVIKQIEKEAKEQAEKFGLFIRLKTALEEKGGEERAKAWKKIQEYKPEEIIRLMREKYTPKEMDEVNKAIFGSDGDVKDYDKFKKEFGAELRAIREQGFQGKLNEKDDDTTPVQIDFGALTSFQRQKLVATLGEERVGRVEQIFKKMQDYITRKDYEIAYKETDEVDESGEKTGKKILTTKGTVFDKDHRFADIYDKTLVTDDILLGKLERLDEKQKAFGMIELSKMWSSDLGGDAYVRNMNDLAAGHTYADELIGFLKETNEEEKFKHAETAASKASDYNGRGGQARVLRHTIVPFMEASMPPGFLDTLGVEKLPFRIKMTLIEDIYGHQAKPLTQDKRREMMDKLEARLESAIQSHLNEIQHNIEKYTRDLQVLDPADPNYGEEKERLEGEIKKEAQKKDDVRKKGEEYRHRAEKVLQIRGRDLFKQKAVTLLLFLIIASLGEGAKLVLTDTKS